jgi:hypothetical protein
MSRLISARVPEQQKKKAAYAEKLHCPEHTPEEAWDAPLVAKAVASGGLSRPQSELTASTELPARMQQALVC